MMEMRLLTMPWSIACSYWPVETANGLVVYIAMEAIPRQQDGLRCALRGESLL